jgi:hypothetical protein
MRAPRAPIAIAAALSIAGVVACGLYSGGLLAADAGKVDTTVIPGDAAVAASDDGDDAAPIQVPGDAAVTASDDASPLPADASTPARADAGPVKDAAPDAPPFTCSGCAAQKCPTQLAACGAGSDCLAYRDCDEACTGTKSSTCTSQCESMYTAGEAAFGALTLCDFGCGAGCVAGLAIGTP